MLKSRRVLTLFAFLMGSALTACGSSGEPPGNQNFDVYGDSRGVEDFPANADGTDNGFDELSRAAPSSGAGAMTADRGPRALDRLGFPDRTTIRPEEKVEFGKAEQMYKEALAIAESNEGPHHPRVAEIWMTLATLYYRQGKLAEAERSIRLAIEILDQAYGDDDPRYASALNNLAAVLFRQNRYADAESLYNRALVVFRSKLGPNHPHVGQTLTNLGKLHQAKFAYNGARKATGGPDPAQNRSGAKSPSGDDALARNAADPGRKNKAEGVTAGGPPGTDTAKPKSRKRPKKQVLIVDEGSWKSVSAKGADAATADLKNLSYSWDLDGDGHYETRGQTVRFDASNIDGPYNLVLRVRVSDDDGGSIVGTIEAQVRNVSPTGDAGGPYEVMEGSAIQVLATGNDAAPADRKSLGFAWDLDGDGIFEASGKSVKFDAANIDGPKPVKIRLRVTDDDGGVSQVTTTVVVKNAAPRIEAIGGYVVREGSAVTLRAKAKDPSAADQKVLAYAWDLDGDGAYETRGMTARFDAADFDGPLKKTVKVRVTDDDGGVHVLPVEIEVTNVSPSLEIGGPYRVEEGGKVTLAVKGSDPAESDRKTLIYAWDLDGDGTFEVNGRTVEFDATTLDGPLSHTVRVRVSDNDGGSQSGDVKISVTNVPPTLEDDRKFVVDEGGKVDIRIAATDPSAADAGRLSFEWDLDGDGKFETSGETVVFDATGIDGPSFRRVKVRVSDDDGGTVIGEVKVKIRNVAPSAVIIQVGG